MFRTLKKAQQGFTIIELLIVIAIIAILAGLVLNNFQGAQAKARDTQRVTDINTIHSKLEEFYNENGGYPNTFSSFPGMDPQAMIDPRGQPIDNDNTPSDSAANAASSAAPSEGANYAYVAYGPAGCTNNCTGYILESLIEKPTATTPDPYSKPGLNNN